MSIHQHQSPDGAAEAGSTRLMGADRWSVCPRCFDMATAQMEAARGELAAAYGKVPAEEYERLRKLAETDIEHDDTVREDWDIYGFDEGVIHVGYLGRCKTCGLEAKIQYDLKFYPEEEVNAGQD